jgi:geranyl-CoA carboxylase alpha subunit
METRVKRFDKVLVANRGEIAVRVIRGARRAGYRTVAVFSDVDRHSLHVREADEAVHIGAAPAKDSYLRGEAVIAAAQRTGAQAIHPGYGFLSENADFARAVMDAGLVWIGPPAEAIEAMGNKSASKERMLAADVPCVPGYQGSDQSTEHLVREAEAIGVPVMVKAAAGGGGRGMRLVTEPGELAAAIDSARSEAESAFGSGQLLLEKAVVDARHVEIQVFGDVHGNAVHIGERDCSIQRRNQKVVEEAPSPAVDAALRQKMGEAAVAAAKAVGYVGAGTVEFLLAADGAFYFLEMNTRLQVEHPVTELVYDLDLVEWQLRVAQGEALPLTQAEIDARRRGHAIEVRLCAEDPAAGYVPQSGPVIDWRAPEGPGIRVDTYLESGAEISPYYDSMQAKIIAWGEDRETARIRLLRALEHCFLAGVRSNRDFLRAIVGHEAFADGSATTAFIAQHFAAEAIADTQPSPRHVLLAAVALYMDDALKLAAEHGFGAEYRGWHSSHEAPTAFHLRWGETDYHFKLFVAQGSLFRARVEGEELELRVEQPESGRFRYDAEDGSGTADYARSPEGVWVSAEGCTYGYEDRTLAPVEGAAPGSDGRILSHSDGKIVAVHAKPGERVTAGQTLVVLEAMKMEFQLSTPVAGTVESVEVEVGQQVGARQLLVALAPEASADG